MFGGLVAAALALAMAEPAAPLSVEWKAHDGCPGLNEYWRAVVTRSSRIRRASTGETAPRAQIVIRKSGDRSVGALTLGGAPREVAAETCAEVVDALALMTVLALDPDALVASDSVTTSPPPAPPAPPASIVATPPPPDTTVTPLVDTPRPAIVARPAASWGLTLAAGGQLHAIGDGAAHGGVAALEVDRGSLALRLALGRARSDLVRDDRGPMARFAFDTARVDACSWTWGATLRFAPCLGLSAGTVTGTFENVGDTRPERHPWLALHVHGRGELRFSHYLGLEFELGLVAPFLRESYVIEPDQFIYRVPPVLLSSQLSLAVHFP